MDSDAEISVPAKRRLSDLVNTTAAAEKVDGRESQLHFKTHQLAPNKLPEQEFSKHTAEEGESAAPGHWRMSLETGGVRKRLSKLKDAKVIAVDVRLPEPMKRRFTDQLPEIVATPSHPSSVIRGSAPAKLKPSLQSLASILVERFGSLERAFNNFDLHQKGKITRTQWDASVAVLKLNMSDASGFTSKEIFRLMAKLDEREEGEISLQKWMNFFKKHLEDDGLALLTEDRGAQSIPRMSVFLHKSKDVRSSISPGKSKSSSLVLAKHGSEPADTWSIQTKQTFTSHVSASNGTEDRASASDAVDEDSLIGSSTDSDSESTKSPKLILKQAEAEKLNSGMRLRRMLKQGKPKAADMQVLSAEELQALAEHVQIELDLKEMGLNGKNALAYLLIQKLGSLKKAFQWFTAKEHHVVPAGWDTGFNVLHVDVERLTGWSAMQIFKEMDQDPADGRITRKEWKRFFKEVEDDAESEKAFAKKRAEGMLYQRAGKLRVSWKRKGTGVADDNNLTTAACCEEYEELFSQEEDFRSRVGQELVLLPAESSMNFGFEWLDQTSEYGGHLLSTLRRAEIIQEVAQELRLWSQPSPAILELRICRAEEKNPELSMNSFANTMLAGGSLPDDAGSVLVSNLKDFVEDVNAKLQGLHEESLEFPSSLTELQRSVVHALAKRIGLLSLSEGKGSARRIVVYRNGNFAKQLVIQLVNLTEGQSSCLPNFLTPARLTVVLRRIVHRLAADMGFWPEVGRDSDGLVTMEVFNHADFTRRVREELSELAIGKTRKFPCNQLTQQQCKIVHFVAGELGLSSMEKSKQQQRYILVDNMVTFLKKAWRRMVAQANLAGTLSFAVPMKPEQQKCLWDLVAETGFHCPEMARAEAGECTEVSIERMQATVRAPSGFKSISSIGANEQGGENAVVEVEAGDEDDAEDSEQTAEAHLISRVFPSYASGSWRGQQLFLRAADLKEFAEDVKYAMPEAHDAFSRLTRMFEFIFEETQQLQIDMGVRAGAGLTYDWFQVFLQKVIRRLGIRFVALLFTLLDPE